jgi:hydroxyacylglutathione hydrolase
MLQVKTFTFNDFQENTYLLYDDTKEAIIIDAGCYYPQEEQLLKDFVAARELKVLALVNTHGHIDHVWGNAAMLAHYQVPLIAHEGFEEEVEGSKVFLKQYEQYGFVLKPFASPSRFVKEGDEISFGNTKLSVLFTPGHSPHHLSFFDKESNSLFSGDVLFKDGIGRWDFRGGNYDTLLTSIKEVLLPLGDEVKVYAGHNEATTIGRERKMNPYLR